MLNEHGRVVTHMEVIDTVGGIAAGSHVGARVSFLTGHRHDDVVDAILEATKPLLASLIVDVGAMKPWRENS